MTPPYPNGLAAIIRAYGNPLAFVDDQAAWEAVALVTVPLRCPLPYAYQEGVEVRRVRCHRLVADALVEVLAKCVEARVPPDRIAYGGCYAWRAKRSSERLSLHAWGIAVDLDPARNPMGKPHDPERGMPPAAVELFEAAGWEWGGRWSHPDPMHFQAASGY